MISSSMSSSNVNVCSDCNVGWYWVVGDDGLSGVVEIEGGGDNAVGKV
jgi:hypothetical protein